MEATFYNGTPVMVNHTPGSAVSGGQVLEIGTYTAIAHNDIAASGLGAVCLANGVYKVQKEENLAVTIWSLIYWDDNGNPEGGTAGSGCATTTSTGNNVLGIATEAAGADDTFVYVYKLPFATTLTDQPLRSTITDPGNAGAIPVTLSGTCQIVTAGAETRTLAAPAAVGLDLLLCMKTDGGDGVITCATAVNQTGNNTITMNDAGDSIRLNAIQNGANIRWRVVYNDGCTLSTV